MFTGRQQTDFRLWGCPTGSAADRLTASLCRQSMGTERRQPTRLATLSLGPSAVLCSPLMGWVIGTGVGRGGFDGEDFPPLGSVLGAALRPRPAPHPLSSLDLCWMVQQDIRGNYWSNISVGCCSRDISSPYDLRHDVLYTKCVRLVLVDKYRPHLNY